MILMARRGDIGRAGGLARGKLRSEMTVVFIKPDGSGTRCHQLTEEKFIAG